MHPEILAIVSSKSLYVCPTVRMIYQLLGPQLHGQQRFPFLAKAGSSIWALLYTQRKGQEKYSNLLFSLMSKNFSPIERKVIGVRTSLRGKSFLILADLKSFRKMKKGRGALSLLYSSYHDYILFQAKWNNVGDVPSILFGARFLYFPNESKICMREKLVDHHNLHGKKEIRDFSKIFFFSFLSAVISFFPNLRDI